MSLYHQTHRARMAPFEGVPGPEPIWPTGNATDFLGKRPWEVCAEYGRRYGPVSVFYLIGEPVLLLHDPDLITQVLETDRETYYKDNPCGALMPVLTDSSPNINNGAEWAEKRRVNPLTQMYAREWCEGQLGALRALFADRFADLVESTADGAIPIQEQVQRIIFDAFSVAAVGRVIGDQPYEDFLEIATQGSRRMLSGLPFGKELNPFGVAARKRWLGTFESCLEEARQNPDPGRTDLIGLVVREGTSLPDAAIHAEMGNIFYGGDFSVPSTLVTAMWCLTQHPEEAERLRAELEALPPDFDLDALDGCAHLDHVLREALRYRTAVPLFDRRVRTDRTAELGGLTLPPNSHIFITNWLLHADEKHYGDPERFRPDRWGDGFAEANPLGSEYFFPMGRGPRMCMGADFAMYTMKLFLATLYRSHVVEAGRDQPYDAGQRYYFGVRMPWGTLARISS